MSKSPFYVSQPSFAHFLPTAVSAPAPDFAASGVQSNWQLFSLRDSRWLAQQRDFAKQSIVLKS